MEGKNTAICDVCLKRKMRTDFYHIADPKRGRGICKACAKDMYYDEDEDIEYFAATAHLFRLSKPKEPPKPMPPPPPEQIKLF